MGPAHFRERLAFVDPVFTARVDLLAALNQGFDDYISVDRSSNWEGNAAHSLIDKSQFGRRRINNDEQRPRHVGEGNDCLTGSEARQSIPEAFINAADCLSHGRNNLWIGNLVQHVGIHQSENLSRQVLRQLRNED